MLKKLLLATVLASAVSLQAAGEEDQTGKKWTDTFKDAGATAWSWTKTGVGIVNKDDTKLNYTDYAASTINVAATAGIVKKFVDVCRAAKKEGSEGVKKVLLTKETAAYVAARLVGGALLTKTVQDKLPDFCTKTN